MYPCVEHMAFCSVAASGLKEGTDQAIVYVCAYKGKYMREVELHCCLGACQVGQPLH